MNKIGTVQHLSREQTAPGRREIRSETELQTELARLVEELSRDLASLSEEHKTTTRAVLQRITQAAQRAEQSIQSSSRRAEQQARSLRRVTQEATQAAERIRAEASALRWTVLAWVGISGLMLGAGLLVLLQILQPQLAEALWRMGQAIQ